MKRSKHTVKGEEEMVTIISKKDELDTDTADLEFRKKNLEADEEKEPAESWLKNVLPDDAEDKKESKGVDRKRNKKSKKNSVSEAAIDKTDREICPVCGRPLTVGRQGGWCVNSDCPVLDDADDYI